MSYDKRFISGILQRYGKDYYILGEAGTLWEMCAKAMLPRRGHYVSYIRVAYDEHAKSVTLSEYGTHVEAMHEIEAMLIPIPNGCDVDIEIVISKVNREFTEVIASDVTETYELRDALKSCDDLVLTNNKQPILRLNGKASDTFEVLFTETESHQYIDINGKNKGESK